MQLTSDQLQTIKEQAELLYYSSERRESLALAAKLENDFNPDEIGDAVLRDELKAIIGKLKWSACPILGDREFFSLFRDHFLEGIELNNFQDLLTARFDLQLEFGLVETANGILLALRENMQTIGPSSIMVKGETKPARPVIHNWLIDFLREATIENPGEMEGANYLFANHNALALNENDRKKLGQVLSFYNDFRLLAIRAAQDEQKYRAVLPEILEEENTQRTRTPLPPLVPPTQPAPPIGQPARPPRPSITPPRQPSYALPPRPTLPPTPVPPTKTPDSYREPVNKTDTDIENRFKPEPKQPESKINGNVIDLRKME